MTITAADVNKLRQMTGAGMMDCKKALEEAGGDYEKAIELLRKKGQKVASNRAGRDAKEGLVIAKVTSDGKKGVLVAVNCETDFVAKNEDFGNFANAIAAIAIERQPVDLKLLTSLPFAGNGVSIAEKVMEYVGKIGEKIEVSKYEVIKAEKVVAYNHPGNKLAAIVGFNKNNVTEEVAKNIAMQVAAMAPVAIDRDDVDPKMLEKEIEIAKELVAKEGKPPAMTDNIVKGKINKFYKESTLLNQEFIKDAKKTVGQYLKETDKELTVTDFKRIALG